MTNTTLLSIQQLHHAPVRELEARRRILDQQIHRLERRGMHMTPHEVVRAAELKRLRLFVKDVIASR